MPKVLDHPARPDDIMNEASENEDEGDEDGQESEAGEYSEAAVREMDDERYDMENGQVQDDMENGFFLLADSDEEIDLLPALHLPSGTTTTKVKSFHLRQAWIDLENEGLCDLPRHITGCSIGYHATTRQWQGYYPCRNTSHTLSSTWGPPTNRSEKESILITIRGVLATHLDSHPKDKLWERQLKKVQDAVATL